jgi:hypothetical protein
MTENVVPFRKMGPVETRTQADLDALGDPKGIQSTLREMALSLAQAIDTYRSQVSSAASLNALSKANQELRGTLKDIMRTTDGDDEDRKMRERMGTPE